MDDKREQSLYWPTPMLEHIQQEALRLDRSLSWCAQAAWTFARCELAKLQTLEYHAAAEAIYRQRFIGEKRKQTLIFPEDMLREIQDEATRQDRSLSWLVQRAWCLSVEHIRAMPSVAPSQPAEP